MQFKIKPNLKIESHGYSNEHITILVEHLHYGEYQLPELAGITSRHAFSGFACSEYIQDAFPEITNEENDKLVEKVYNKRIKEHEGKYGQICKFDTEDGQTDLLTITLWTYDKSQLIKSLGEIYNSAINAFNNSSGDDDYYDYMPGYLTCVAQIMELTGNETEYQHLLKLINETND